VSSFIQLFPSGDDREPPGEPTQPAWLGPPEGELGVELPGGARASNIGGRRLFVHDEPDGPVFIHRGGGGGTGGSDRMTMSHDYWIWPLPQPGTIRVSCEWPLVGIPLSTVEVDGAVLVEAASRVVPFWPAPSA
jgi:hypothetical protein